MNSISIKEHLQLAIIGCATVAAKYEEVQQWSVLEYAKYCYSEHVHVLRAEKDVLRTLNFEITGPHSISFIQRYTQYFKINLNRLAKKICEAAIYDYNTCHTKPSEIAVVCVCLAAALEKVEIPEKLYKIIK
ncbi:unnamed protein product [Gongylonema pulchrum]|uniref:CYCLIN domain-containing protein n=1 Tax=Gongylonema pulchrum TaxID=637853 RepID=A0A183EHA3_9BILA|nr:unnamed protein product [Gongylonema pulchrum]